MVDTSTMEGMVPYLSPPRRLVLFDFLGWGNSDKPAGYPYTTDNQVGDIDAIISQLNLGQVVLVAHDASGPPAIDWALAHSERVEETHNPVLRLIRFADSRMRCRSSAPSPPRPQRRQQGARREQRVQRHQGRRAFLRADLDDRPEGALHQRERGKQGTKRWKPIKRCSDSRVVPMDPPVQEPARPALVVARPGSRNQPPPGDSMLHLSGRARAGNCWRLPAPACRMLWFFSMRARFAPVGRPGMFISRLRHFHPIAHERREPLGPQQRVGRAVDEPVVAFHERDQVGLIVPQLGKVRFWQSL